ncbi:glycosyltransferase family 2 protein [Marinobacter sp. F3R11]|uniref:glycosyltransferase family 2 protein n=1 Tax=Marinobacter sp. F3R11 TaxID=2267231 RepID=UPI000DE970AD|nr:glycosyltransferase family 2 protein [Marinobacter sp. F3R11]RBW48282.1 glycosyltransferase family 2 protein [Marinobacter sp. F3R11]
MTESISVVIPAKNEARNLGKLLLSIREELPGAEIIVVNDGSTDNTREVAEGAGARCVNHEYSVGNGAAIKSGARAAKGEVIVFMDGDGQHDPRQIRLLLEKIDLGADLVVGARHSGGQANIGRSLANKFYNWFASLVTGFKIQDLTSGFRAVNANKFRQFLNLLPNGFSYPTTSTMAFLRSGYSVRFVPIEVAKREGKSHIRPIRDGIRFLLIIFKVATLYSPLKVFVPLAAICFALGLSRYGYTYWYFGTFTNMSALLMVAAVQIFLIGLVSEQITSLIYKDRD